jgi:hypothetical protein
MVYELLKRAIEQKNPYMPEDMLRLQTEFFATAGKITTTEKEELLALLPPVEEPTI